MLEKGNHSYEHEPIKWVIHNRFFKKGGFIVYATLLQRGYIGHAHQYYYVYRELSPPERLRLTQTEINITRTNICYLDFGTASYDMRV